MGCLAPKHGRGCSNASARKTFKSRNQLANFSSATEFPKTSRTCSCAPATCVFTNLPKCRKTHSPLDLCFQIVTHLFPKHHPCHNLPLPPSFPLRQSSMFPEPGNSSLLPLLLVELFSPMSQPSLVLMLEPHSRQPTTTHLSNHRASHLDSVRCNNHKRRKSRKHLYLFSCPMIKK